MDVYRSFVLASAYVTVVLNLLLAAASRVHDWSDFFGEDETLDAVAYCALLLQLVASIVLVIGVHLNQPHLLVVWMALQTFALLGFGFSLIIGLVWMLGFWLARPDENSEALENAKSTRHVGLFFLTFSVNAMCMATGGTYYQRLRRAKNLDDIHMESFVPALKRFGSFLAREKTSESKLATIRRTPQKPPVKSSLMATTPPPSELDLPVSAPAFVPKPPPRDGSQLQQSTGVSSSMPLIAGAEEVKGHEGQQRSMQALLPPSLIL